MAILTLACASSLYDGTCFLAWFKVILDFKLCLKWRIFLNYAKNRVLIWRECVWIIYWKRCNHTIYDTYLKCFLFSFLSLLIIWNVFDSSQKLKQQPTDWQHKLPNVHSTCQPRHTVSLTSTFHTPSVKLATFYDKWFTFEDDLHMSVKS